AQVVGVERIHVDEVAVSGVAGRRCRTEEAGATGVVAILDRAGRQARAVVVSGILGEFGDVGWDGGDGPVPEPGPGGGVGVEDRDGVALGVGRRSRPRQLRGDVPASRYTEDARHLVDAEGVAFGQRGAGDGEAGYFRMSCKRI